MFILRTHVSSQSGASVCLSPPQSVGYKRQGLSLLDFFFFTSIEALYTLAAWKGLPESTHGLVFWIVWEGDSNMAAASLSSPSNKCGLSLPAGSNSERLCP